MKLAIRTQGNVKFSENVRNHVNDELATIDKLFDEREDITLNLFCSEKDDKYKTELTIRHKQIVLRAECNGDTLYAAIDQAIDKLEQQIIKYKKRLISNGKKRESIKDIDSTDFIPEEVNTLLVRTKKVDLLEMSPDEAINQMELVDHDFFLFKNIDTHECAVVYKRKTGGYGLLEPNK